MLFLSTRNQRLGALVPASLATLAIAAPYLLTHGWPAAAFVLERGFALVCHQRPERSLIVFGAPVAICARCLVQPECLAFAMRTQQFHGIWGGLTEHERGQAAMTS